MIDFHTHTFASDGELVPAELVRRAAVKGYRVIGITDHADSSNLSSAIAAAGRAAASLDDRFGAKVIPGVELTHCPPVDIPRLIGEARSLGAALVIVHGETIVEPVAAGTNSRAITGGADIIAHPGFISRRDALRAAEKGVYLEITARKGHSLANGYVTGLARETGAPLVFGTDSHSPADLVTRLEAETIAKGAGLDRREVRRLFANAEGLVTRLTGNR